jgi:integrase
VEPSKRTVRSYLLEEWLPENQPPRLRPSSFANYTIYTRIHVVPRLGEIELQRLSPANLSGFYRGLLTDARRDGQGLAPKTVRNIHAMLHRALKDAVRLGYLVRNVADAVTPPRGVSPEMQVWSPEQLRAFLTHARHDRLYALWLLVATTGMRRAELAGLRWIDVDLDAARLSPRRPRVRSTTSCMSPSPRRGWASGHWRSTRPRWPPSRNTRLNRSRNKPMSGRPGPTRV